MDKKIEAAIKETLVVTNKESIYRTVDRIKLIVAQEQALQQTECKKLLPPIMDSYNDWCKQTARTGSVLVGSSIKEFFKYHEAKINEVIGGK